MRFASTVSKLIGRGREGDPVRGVILSDGTELAARWVFGADGRNSTVARQVASAKRDVRRGEQSFLFAYWRGLPPTEWFRMDIHDARALMSTPCEDGIHLLVLAADPTLVRGTQRTREDRYRAGLRRFPTTLNPRLLDRSTMISDVIAAPEAMMRGFYRQAVGPGWALVGDAGHFKHPSTAQGIADAIEQAEYVALAVNGTDPDLAGYAAWRDRRANGFYEWSFELARLPDADRTAAQFAGLSTDAIAAQQWRDSFCQRVNPSVVITMGRSARWRAAWAYEDAQRQLAMLVRTLPPEMWDTLVPACPGWSVHDVVAHLDGVAADTIRECVPGGLLDAWRDDAAATARDRWTKKQVTARAGLCMDALLDSWEADSRELVRRLRRGIGFPDGNLSAINTPAVDLAVHVQDIRGAVGCPGDRESSATRLAFRAYVAWLDERIRATGLPALRLTDGTRDWLAGDGAAGATLLADQFELFRAISGRRSPNQLAALNWAGDTTPYQGLLSPYPPPQSPLVEPHEVSP